MKSFLLLGSAVLTCASGLLGAPITFATGAPNFNSNNALTPHLSTVVNFDDAATVTQVVSSGGNYTLPSNFYASAGVASITDPSGVFVQPYSTQSEPDYLTNGNASTNGEADITIMLTKAQGQIGMGVGDSDGVPITLNLLGAGGVTLATQIVSLPTNTQNPYNGYYTFFDTTPDIWGISIVQNQNLSAIFPSGVAVDDLQFAPEPGSLLLVLAGVLLLGFSQLRKRA